MRWPLYLIALGLGLAGCAGPASGTDTPSDPIAGGRKLYLAKCAKCHKFYDPAKYTDAEWAMWMQKMAKKARLKPEQKQLLFGYIDETLRRPQPGTPARGSTP
jgi:mono/diheme cytochrome c family protein